TEVEKKLAFAYVQSESQASAGQSPETAWEYGTGEFDPASKQVSHFSRMTTFAKGAWRLLPQRVRGGDQREGLAALTPQGGVTSREFSAIRRWTAPRDGFVSIDAVLGEPPKNTNAVVGCIVSSRSGLLG